MLGTTPEEMHKLGFKPVGRHFPVFLHPDTKEEYALARTERKTGTGYHGFEFYVGSEVTPKRICSEGTSPSMPLHATPTAS